MEAFDTKLDDVGRAVAACGLFSSLTASLFDDVCASFDGVRVTTGETLIRQDDIAGEMFIVRHGRLRASIAGPDGTDIPVGEIGKNEVVGEMAVITDQRRSATIRAMRDTDLFRLPADAFGHLIQRHPEMLRPFASVVVKRLRMAMTTPVRAALPATMVLVPTDGENLIEFAHELARALTGFTTAVLSADDAVDRSHPAAWLLDVENDVQISILVADREPTEWTRLCLRHADRVNIVAGDSTDVGPTPVETDPACRARLKEVPVHLLMRYDRSPTTAAWLRLRSVDSHTNIRRGSDDDIDRLARVVTGTSTILVLGGGGARGFAHFGVARALREASIPIDGIIGTSAGALVGGVMAVIDDLDDAQHRMVEWFESARWRRDFNPPTVALTSGRMISHALQRFSGNTLIENLPIEFAAVSCDLVTARPFVHDRGLLWQAVRASASVPGVFPPIGLDGRLLVDGGLVDNLPAQVARERHPHARIIAVDVGDPSDVDVGDIDGSGIVNGWERVRRPGRSGGASLARVMMRLTELGRHDAADVADLADVIIRPDVRGFGLIETKRAREIVARGYAAGRAAIESGLA